MAAKTRYVILRETQAGEIVPGVWEKLTGEYEGASREAAIEAAIVKLGVDTGRFVAIPISAWSPGNASVKVETKVSIVFEGPKRRRKHGAAAGS